MPHASRKGGDPGELAVEDRLCAAADDYLTEHGIVDVDSDVQPGVNDDVKGILMQKAFENAMFCVGLVTATTLLSHPGRTIFHA